MVSTTNVLYIFLILKVGEGSVQLDVKEGSNCQLNCQFSPTLLTHNPMIYWSRDNAAGFEIIAIKSNSRIPNYILHDNSPAGIFNLHIYNATLQDNGTFKCLVLKNGSAAPLFKKVIDLTVIIPPTAPIISPSIFRGVEGDRVNISCVAWGNPPPLLFWYLEEEDCTSHSIFRKSFKKVDSSSSLILEMTKEKDQKIIFCFSWNRGLGPQEPKLRAEMQLHVNYYPRVKIMTRTEKIRIGSVVHLLCVVDAKPMVEHVEWMKDGDIQNTTSFWLVIHNMTFNHQGLYVCRADNGILRHGENGINIQVWVPSLGSTELTTLTNSPEDEEPSSSILMETLVEMMERYFAIGLSLTMTMVIVVIFCGVWSCHKSRTRDQIEESREL